VVKMASSWKPHENYSGAYSYAIPNQPAFTVAEVSTITRKARTTVWYWLKEGKLQAQSNSKGEPYILKEELHRFIQDYLLPPQNP